MDDDRICTEYYLTPRGWIAGACIAENLPPTSSSQPTACIETWLECESSHDVYSKPTRTWKRLWKSLDYSEEECKHSEFECELGPSEMPVEPR
jgi:hypothetical protein